MKTILIAVFFILLYSPFVFAQFNSVSKEKNTTNVSLFVSIKQPNKAQTSNDTLLHTSVKKQKEILAEKLYVDSIKASAEKKPMIYLPLENISVNSFFGYRKHPVFQTTKFHYGVDLKAKSDIVFATVGGTVENSGYSKGLGYYVSIRFKEYVFYYGHLSEYYVLKGEIVEAGQQIGKTGNTGISTGEHLHFAIKKNEKFINPIAFLNQ